MLELSPAAATYIRTVREQNGKSDHMLRVARGTGADSAHFRLALVAAAHPGDQVGESEGVPVCVASEVSADLDGKLIDFSDTESGVGLVLRKAAR